MIEIASKSKQAPAKSGVPPEIQQAGEAILLRRNIDPKAWREELINREKMAIFSGANLEWETQILERAYALLIAEEYNRTLTHSGNSVERGDLN